MRRSAAALPLSYTPTRSRAHELQLSEALAIAMFLRAIQEAPGLCLRANWAADLQSTMRTNNKGVSWWGHTPLEPAKSSHSWSKACVHPRLDVAGDSSLRQLVTASGPHLDAPRRLPSALSARYFRTHCYSQQRRVLRVAAIINRSINEGGELS